MKTKFSFLFVISFCATQLVSGQIGVVSVATPPAYATAAVGKGSDYGKSTLPVCMPRSVSCSQAFTYTFIGNGNWTLESNWEGNVVPPTVLPQGATILIDPVVDGECVLNTFQTIASNAAIKIKAGKKFKVQNNLTIQN